MPNRWKQVCVPPTASIEDAIRKIDQTALQIALVVEGERLCGTLTDGDIRRAMLHGLTLKDPVSKAMNPNPKTAFRGESREAVIAQMRQLRIRQMPIVSFEGSITGLEIIDEMIAPPALINRVVIMAGGVGKRLSPLTDTCPKPMLQVGGRPILETVLLTLLEYGFHNYVIAVNYRADMIMDHFGDGSRWGVNIEYLHEEKPLGTAGALRLMPDRPISPFILMNGDILTKVNFNHLLDFHSAQNSKATMCVRDFEFQVPFGVVKVDGYQILEIEEKPTKKFFVNAGIYVLDSEVIDLIAPGEQIDMTNLFEKVIENKCPHAVFPIREYWIDIGRHADLDNAKIEFETKFQ